MEQIQIADPGHPAGAFQVRVVDTADTLGIARRVEVEKDLGDFAPVRLLRVGVEETQVGF